MKLQQVSCNLRDGGRTNFMGFRLKITFTQTNNHSINNLIIYCVVPMKQQDEDKVVRIEPANWRLLQIGQHKFIQIHHILASARHHLQTIRKAKVFAEEGSGDINTTILRNVVIYEKQIIWDDYIQKLQKIINQLFPHFQSVTIEQQKITLSFINAILNIMRQNRQKLQAMTEISSNWKKDEYVIYIAQQLLKALIELKMFIQNEAKLYEECASLTTFCRNYLYSPAVKSNIEMQEPSTHYLSHPSNMIPNHLQQFKQLEEQIQTNLTLILQEVQLPQQSSFEAFKVISYLSLAVLALSLGFLSYSFAVYDKFGQLSEYQGMWTGAGAYLAYLWINLYVANCCFSRKINVVLGMGCLSQEEIQLFRPVWLIVLLFLTIIYVWCLVVQLQWVQDVWMGFAINGLLVVLWIVEFILRFCYLKNVPAFSSKFSFLHFLVLIIPINDIIGSFLVKTNFRNDLRINCGIYVLATIAAVMLQAKYKEIKNQISFINIYVALAGVTVLLQITTAFVQSKILLWIFLSFNYTLLFFYVGNRFESSMRGFLSRLYFDISFSWSEDKVACILKTLQIVMGIVFILILPLGINWNLIHGDEVMHRYAYVGLLILCYLAWSLVYINDINLKLKHPISNCTHPTYSAKVFSWGYQIEKERSKQIESKKEQEKKDNKIEPEVERQIQAQMNQQIERAQEEEEMMPLEVELQEEMVDIAKLFGDNVNQPLAKRKQKLQESERKCDMDKLAADLNQCKEKLQENIVYRMIQD